MRKLTIVITALVSTSAFAQTSPLPLRAGAPKPWEDRGMWTADGDWAVSPNGNCQQRIGLFAWAPPGVGAPISIALVYNSADAAQQRGLGFGFRLGVTARLLVASSDGTVTVEEPDGTSRRFTPRRRAGRFRSEPFDQAILTQSGTQYILTSKPRYQRVFDTFGSSGYLERARIDRTGDTVTFSYDDAGQLVRISDSAGRQATFTRTDGLLTQIVDPEGRTFTLAYDQGMLVSITAPAVAGGAPRTELGYDTTRNLLTSRRSWGGAVTTTYSFDAAGRLSGIGFSDGVANRIDYGASEVALTDALARTSVLKFAGGAVIEAIAQNGLRTQIARDASQRPIQIIDGFGRVTSYAYGDNDDVVQFRDPLGRLTRLAYDNRHNLLSTTTPLGQTTSFAYNNHDQLKQIISPISEITKLHYDSAGNLLKVVDFAGKVRFKATYDERGKPLTTQGQDRLPTLYTYDANANLTSMTSPGSVALSRTSSPLGRTLSYTNPLGEQSTYSYDPLGRLSRLDLVGGRSVTPTLDLDGRLIGMDVQLGGRPQVSAATLTTTSSLATWQVNGVPVQTAPAMLAATPAPPAHACAPSCAGRCGLQIADTCGGTLDCSCASGFGCSAAGECLKGQP